MSDKFQGGVLAGSVDVSLPVLLLKVADNFGKTGGVAADMTLSYWRQGGVRVAVSASDLAAVNSAHSDGGVKEVDAINMPGHCRVDWPDAAFAVGADWVTLTVLATDTFGCSGCIPITTNVIQAGDSFARIGATGAGLTTITAKTDNLPSDPADQSLVIAATTAIIADTGAIKTQTDKLTFTVANVLDANALRINSVAGSAANLAKTTSAIGRGTVAALATTSSIPTSAFTPAGAAANQFLGRIITFDADTTTAALRGQSTDITANTNAAAPTFTVTALTTAAVAGDSFSVT